MDHEEPDPDPAIAEVRAAAIADAAARARHQQEQNAARAEVLARARAAGWSLTEGTVWYPRVVAVIVGLGLLPYAFFAVIKNPVALVFVVVWILPLVRILSDYHQGPLAQPRRNETIDRRWVVPAVTGILGIAVGVVAMMVVDAVRHSSTGCVSQAVGDCGFGLILAAVFFGLPAVVLATSLILLAARVRHAFSIAALGLVVSVPIAAATIDVAAHSPLLMVVGAAGYALSGVAHARALSPVTRTTALAIA